MRVESAEKVEEAMVVLELNKDFTLKDLEPNRLVGGKLLELNVAVCDRIATQLGYNNWSWVSHYDEVAQIIRIRLRRALEAGGEKGEKTQIS